MGLIRMTMSALVLSCLCVGQYALAGDSSLLCESQIGDNVEISDSSYTNFKNKVFVFFNTRTSPHKIVVTYHPLTTSEGKDLGLYEADFYNTNDGSTYQKKFAVPGRHYKPVTIFETAYGGKREVIKCYLSD